MRLVKWLLILLGILIAALLISAAFVPKSYSVKREILINKPIAEVFSYIRLLKNQDNYSKWNSMDPGMKKSYRGTDGTVGFVAAWDSKNDEVGKGEQEIKQIDVNRRIDFELRFLKPFEATEAAYMTTGAVSDTQTLVSWGFNGSMNYPMNIMLLIYDFEEMIGSDLETGLKNLKKVME